MYIEKFKYVFLCVFLILLPDTYARGETGYGVSNVFTLDTRITVGVEEENKTPKGFYVYQNYPNPFNPTTTIKYTIPKNGKVEVNIYDVTGAYIRTLENRYLSVGTHRVQWDGRDNFEKLLSSGIYFYRVKFGRTYFVKKMQFIK